MRSVHLAVLLALIAATAQGAQTLTRDGVTTPGSAGSPVRERTVGLVNDGSFEFGECGLGSAWACAANTSCQWILDPRGIWGYPAYDGVLAAWLGGFCDGVPNTNSFCQDIALDPGWGAWLLTWRFMGYVNGACSTLRITVDGEEEWQYAIRAWDHTYGTWGYSGGLGDEVVIHAYGGAPFRLCFEWEACPDGVDNDNMLIDYVTIDFWVWDGDNDEVAAAASSFSVVKSRY